MKKVIFVTNTLGRAGAERTLMALLDIFDREKYEVSLFSIIPKGEFFESIPQNVKILNKKYSSDSVMDKTSVFSNIWTIKKALLKNFYFIRFIPYAIKNLCGQIKGGKFSFDKLFWLPLAMSAPAPREEYDLAVAYLEGASTYYVSKRLNAKKKVAFLHIDYAKSGYVHKLDKPYYENMDKIFCVSQSVLESITTVFPEFADKTETFQNTISDSFVKESAEKGEGFKDGFDGIRLLTIGRLHYQKAYDIAIPAFARLLSEYDINARWYVIGEGLERPQLEKLIAKYDLEDKFILMGAKSNPYPYLKECDIYVHATRYEGWCIATAEARILGRPIIASDTAGIREQLSSDCALIISLSEENIVKSVSEIILDAQKRKALAAASAQKWERPNDLCKLYALLGDVTAR